MRNIILASKSPRRIEMFKTCGYNLQVYSKYVEENIPLPLSDKDGAMYLALKKAMAVAGDFNLSNDTVVVGADTVVSTDFGILGKPVDREDAKSMILSMKNSSHNVITGVSIVGPKVKLCFYSLTTVHFKDYNISDLEDYLDSDEPYDKAGGYGIQGTFGKYISHIQGDKNNVIGFPMTLFENQLKYYISLCS